jgi:hypothetical protein
MEDLEGLFDDHPSLDASLGDFEHHDSTEEAPFQSPLLSSHRSRSAKSDSSASRSPESPSWGDNNEPWRRRSILGSGGGGMWLHHQPYIQKHLHDRVQESGISKRSRSDSPVKTRWSGSPFKSSRESSPRHYESAEEADITLTSRLNLKRPSPLNNSVSPSPEVYPDGEDDFGDQFGAKETEKAVVKPEEIANNSNNCKSTWCIRRFNKD